MERILYISMVPTTPSHAAKLAGIRCYCALRGWEVVASPPRESTPESIPGTCGFSSAK